MVFWVNQTLVPSFYSYIDLILICVFNVYAASQILMLKYLFMNFYKNFNLLRNEYYYI